METLLFLTPQNQHHLSSNIEYQNIQAVLVKDGASQFLNLQDHSDFDPVNTAEIVDDSAPHLFHYSSSQFAQNISNFCGNCFEDFPLDEIGSSFDNPDLSVLCAIFNGSHTDKVAEAVAPYVRFAIGTETQLKEEDAQLFAKTFYKTLTKSEYPISDFRVCKSFSNSVGVVRLKNKAHEEKRTYVLMTNKIKMMSTENLNTLAKFYSQEDISPLLNKLEQLEKLEKEALELSKQYSGYEENHRIIEWLILNAKRMVKDASREVFVGYSDREKRRFEFELLQLLDAIKSALIQYSTKPLDYPEVGEVRFNPALHSKALKRIKDNIEERNVEYSSPSARYLKVLLAKLATTVYRADITWNASK